MLRRLKDRLRHELYPFTMYRNVGSLLSYEMSRVARWTGGGQRDLATRVRVRKLAKPVWVRFGIGDALVLEEMFGSEDYARASDGLGAAPGVGRVDGAVQKP